MKLNSSNILKKVALVTYLVAILLGLTTIKSVAQWSSNPATNTGVSTIVMNHANMHQIIPDGSGGSFIVWRDNRNSATSNFDIYAQHFNAAGVAQWTVDGIPICSATDIQTYPYLISDGSDGIIVSWLDKRNGNWDIYAQKLNAAGATQWTANGEAISTQSGNQGTLYGYGYEHGYNITTDGSGGAIIAWMDLRVSNNFCSIYTQRINSAGVVQWTTDGVALYTATKNTNYPPNEISILSDGSGGAFIVTSENRDDDPDNHNLYAYRVNASGVSQWTATGEPICTAANNQYLPSLVTDGANGFIVSWIDGRINNYNDLQLYSQRVNASGVVQWTANGVAITGGLTNNTNRQNCSLISDGANGAIISWDDNRSGNFDIYAQKINGSGDVQWTANGVIICNASNDQTYNTITKDGNNGAIITWQDSRSGTKIYAQRINTSGEVQWTANGIAVATATAQAGQQNPIIIANGAGGAIVVFEDDRQNIYYRSLWIQNIDANGILGNTVTPVSFISFDAKLNNSNTVDLIWLTSSEKNNSHFIIMKSTDGSNFSLLEKISGSGNSDKQNRYQTVDKNPAKGNNYYQLVQYDSDGKASVLSTKVVNVGFSNTLSLYPNPATEKVFVKFSVGEFNKATLINLSGKVLFSENIIAGNNMIEFDVSGLSPSTYIVQLYNHQKSESITFIKK